jgi:hypothetical protein
MSEQEPQIFDLDPEKAPRMTAIILLACGLLGVGFLLINMLGTGDDPYYNQAEWEEGNEPVHQRYDILPNMVRGRQAVGDSDEDEEAQAVPVQKPAAKKTAATTNPLSVYQRLTSPTTPAAPGAPTTPGSPTLPGAPKLPGASTTPPLTPAPGTR